MLKKILVFIVLLFSFIWIQNISFAEFWAEKTGNIYANVKNWLVKWIEITKNTLKWVETKQSFSDYVQSIVAWLLTFLSLVALIYIIYTWFMIIFSWWEDEKMKNQKKTIVAVIIWIIIIWLAYSIVLTLFKWIEEISK